MAVLGWRQLGFCLLVLLATHRGAGENLVTVRALADREYVEGRRTADGLRRETYIVMKGRYFGGLTQDRTMEKMPFDRIARMLAHDLKRREYFPAADFASADLLLVIHWGVTVPSVAEYDENIFHDNTTLQITDARERYAEASANGDIAGAEQAMNDLQGYVHDREHQAVVYANDAMTGEFIGSCNAELLGLKQQLRDDRDALFGSVKAETVEIMVKEERYFVIVFAFDARLLRSEGKLRRLWSARLSTRAAGINFAMAIDRMSNIGGQHFGERVEGVPFEQVKTRKGKVIYGELEVIELGAP